MSSSDPTSSHERSMHDTQESVMPLPAPPYTRTGLDAWLAQVPMKLPCPPGPPSEWTCLFSFFGSGMILDDLSSNHPTLSTAVVRTLLEALGRPMLGGEQNALLLVTPIPAGSVGGAVLDLVRRGQGHVRRWAAICAGRLRIPGALRALTASLMEHDRHGVVGVARGLGYLGDAAAAVHLARHPWGAHDESVDLAVLQALVRLDAWDEILDILAEASDASAMGMAVRAIARAERGGDLGGALDATKGTHESVNRALALYLATRPDKAAQHAEQLVACLLASSDWEARLALARACGRAGEPALEPLADLLEDSAWPRRMDACVALGYASDVSGVAELLLGRLADDDGDVRREAALACRIHGLDREQLEAGQSLYLRTSYRFLERAAEHATRCPGLRVAGMLMGHLPPGRELVTCFRDGDEHVLSVAALLLALHEPELVAPTLETMAIGASSSQTRRFCSAGLLLTGRPPSRLGALHQILLGHLENGTHGALSWSAAGDADEHASQLVVLAMTDRESYVRQRAIMLLGALGSARNVHRAMLEHIARTDDFEPCRQAARALLGATWSGASLADELALLLTWTDRREPDAIIIKLQRLASWDPALAVSLARSLWSAEDREWAQAAARFIGANLQPGEAAAEVRRTIALLESRSWVMREAACMLLGTLRGELLDEALQHQIGEALSARVEEDSDRDVKQAARHALLAHGHRVRAD